MPAQTRLHLPAPLRASLQAHIKASPSLEVCGLVYGRWRPFPRWGLAEGLVRVENVAPTPATHYLMAADELLKALLDFEKNGHDLLAIYHSHPNGDAKPSASDLAEATYPEAVYLIGTPQGALNGWRLVRGQAFPVMLTV